MGFVRISNYIDALGTTGLRYLITSKGHKHLLSTDQKIAIPLSTLEEAILNFELEINRVLRSY
jgi:hypothetical protein